MYRSFITTDSEDNVFVVNWLLLCRGKGKGSRREKEI